MQTASVKVLIFLIFSFFLLQNCGRERIPVYQNPDKPVDDRVQNLLGLLTLEEKADFMAGKDMWHFKGLERLGIPSIQVTDCGHGVTVIINKSGVQGGCSTCFPSGVGQAATWNEDLEYQVGKAIAREVKILGSSILLGPMVNIHRTPLGGRNYETYSEDPYLTGKMASAFIKGVQSENIGACVKAAAVNNQQTNQSNLDVVLSERALREIYLPGFRIPVQEADPWALMMSYNKVTGEYTGEKKYLISDIIKGEWKFKGFVVSDWRGVHSTKSIDAGLDIEMPGPGKFTVKENILKAIKEKTFTEKELDNRVGRILRALILTKVLDKNFRPETAVWDPELHKDIALKAAEEVIVLLKNESDLLPLKKEKIRSLAVIGPNAGEARLGGGGSASVTACYSVSPLNGLKNLLGDSIKINFEEGCSFIGNYPVIYTDYLKSNNNGKTVKGLKGEYFKGSRLEGEPVCTRIDDKIDFSWGWAAPSQSVSGNSYSVRWTGKIIAPETGKYQLGLTCMGGGCRLYFSNKLVMDRWNEPASQNFEDQFARSGQYVPVNMIKNKEYDVRIEFYKRVNINSIRLEWEMPGKDDPVKKAVELARNSDAAVIFAGLSNLFEGGAHDRDNLSLPGDQDKLIREVIKANPNTVVVLINGTPVAMPWIDEVKTVLEAYYPGQEGGNAIARVLFGEVNPSGKLPETFPVRLEDNPSFGNFPGKDNTVNYKEGIYVGYRHYDTRNIKPLFPFGHGLSYTEFSYDSLRLDKSGGKILLSFKLANTGKKDGAEIAQVYIRDMDASVDRPEKELKGFKKVFLKPGKKESVLIEIQKDDLSYFSEEMKKWVFEPGEFEVLVGSSSRDIRLKEKINLN